MTNLWVYKKCLMMLIESAVDAVHNAFLPGIVISLIVVLLIQLIITHKVEFNKNICIWIIILTYYSLVLWQTIFSRRDGTYHYALSFNLYFLESGWYSILQILQNILLLLPLGVLFKILNNKFLYRMGGLTSLFIEVLQFITGRGTFEIADLVLNTIGYFFGGLICQAIMKIIIQKKNEARVNNVNDIRVSAIITTYKRPLEILKRAYNSIRNQTYKNIEIIIVDDSPEDYPERQKIKEYLAKEDVLYIQHEQNQGACAARNTGIANASGALVAFLDDDDEWTETKIELQLKCLNASGAALIYADRYYIINDTTGKKSLKREKAFRGYVYDALMENNFIGSTSFPLIKKEVFEKIGYFDVELKASQDYDMWLRISKEYQVDYIREPVCIYHVHSGIGITNTSANKIQGILRVMEKYEEYYSVHETKYAKRRIALVPNYLKNGEEEKARKELIEAVKKAPLNVKTNLKWIIYYFCFKLKNK